MQVSFNPYSNNCYHRQPAFKSNENEFLNAAGKVVNKTVTYMFRNNIEWEPFTRFLSYKYRTAPKINITNYACSDGSEPLTLAMSVMEFTPEIAPKIFPIIAKDKYQHVLDFAQSGIFNIYAPDLYAINYFTKNKFNHYFQAVPASIPDCMMGVKPREPLQNKIIFKQADILEDLRNLPDENNVILCRNFWTYLNKEQHHPLAEMLYEKTKNNGLIAIGSLENGHGIPKILLQHGFRETGVHNVYEPVKKMTV